MDNWLTIATVRDSHGLSPSRSGAELSSNGLLLSHWLLLLLWDLDWRLRGTGALRSCWLLLLLLHLLLKLGFLKELLFLKEV